MPRTSYDVSSTISYNYDGRLNNKGVLLVPEYSFQYHYNRNICDYYRFDKLNGWGTIEKIPQLGVLPSSHNLMQNALDIQNSYYSKQSIAINQLSLSLGYYFTDTRMLALKPQVRIQKDCLRYSKAEIDTLAKRFFSEIEVAIQYRDEDKMKITYLCSTKRPSMVRLLDVRDNSNPLIVRLGNPRLKTTVTHYFDFNYYCQNKRNMRHATYKLFCNIFENAVAQSLVYNTATGVRTYRPTNINGNWNIGTSFDFSQFLDNERIWTLSNNTEINYNNSIDYISTDNIVNSKRSNVRNLQLKEGFSLSFYDLKFKADVKWLYATSKRHDFENINCFDFNFGVSAPIGLPFETQLSTDLTIHCRRGYNSNLMNDTHIVWNGRLERSFLTNKNLTIGLEGFDILGQLSNIQRTLNSQGLIETWYNNIPQYAMLRVSYRLDIEPKKKL